MSEVNLASELASHSSQKSYVQITFTKSYVCLLLCCHHGLGRHQLPVTKLLHVVHVCQSLLNKDIWIETATLGQDLCTPVKPEVNTWFIQNDHFTFWSTGGLFFFSSFHLTIKNPHSFLTLLHRSRKQRNTQISSALVNINFERKNKKNLLLVLLQRH